MFWIKLVVAFCMFMATGAEILNAWDFRDYKYVTVRWGRFWFYTSAQVAATILMFL